VRWFLAIAGILVVSLALQAGLVAYAGYVLLGIFALSRFLASRWIESLAAECELESGPREIGDSVTITVTVSNAGTLFIPWVLAEHAIAEQVLKQRKLAIEGRRLRVLFLRGGGSQKLKYKVTFNRRGYYQFGPLFLETGDVFGLHRRHRVLTHPAFVLVFPKVLPLARYDFASERPIGEIRLANRLYEDPTRTAGVRPYQLGDPLQRVHWRATARTGELHSRVYEPTTLAGATILLDFHSAGYPNRGEPHRSELAITLAASLAYAGGRDEPADRPRQQRPRRHGTDSRRSVAPLSPWGRGVGGEGRPCRNAAGIQDSGKCERDVRREACQLAAPACDRGHPPRLRSVRSN